jgi:hypothetical protein
LWDIKDCKPEQSLENQGQFGSRPLGSSLLWLSMRMLDPVTSPLSNGSIIFGRASATSLTFYSPSCNDLNLPLCSPVCALYRDPNINHGTIKSKQWVWPCSSNPGVITCSGGFLDLFNFWNKEFKYSILKFIQLVEFEKIFLLLLWTILCRNCSKIFPYFAFINWHENISHAK